MAKPDFIPQKLRLWVDARRRFHLSHAQVQMARELGLNPKKLGGMANHKQQPWKMPLPLYIEHLYKKQLRKNIPDDVRSIEVKVRENAIKTKQRSEQRGQNVTAYNTSFKRTPQSGAA